MDTGSFCCHALFSYSVFSSCPLEVFWFQATSSSSSLDLPPPEPARTHTSFRMSLHVLLWGTLQNEVPEIIVICTVFARRSCICRMKIAKRRQIGRGEGNGQVSQVPSVPSAAAEEQNIGKILSWSVLREISKWSPRYCSLVLWYPLVNHPAP
jgi:hypothetical protein